mmetsp:Transcript_1777/g.6375  ORF Transcript_1777/g.6375 Transcript_1777/m.6375 type:complete len:277 (-) Transcript_1777:94-924(-)
MQAAGGAAAAAAAGALLLRASTLRTSPAAHRLLSTYSSGRGASSGAGEEAMAVPFAVTQQQAHEAFHNWHGWWMAPSKVWESTLERPPRKALLPFWHMEVKVWSTFEGSLGRRKGNSFPRRQSGQGFEPTNATSWAPIGREFAIHEVLYSSQADRVTGAGGGHPLQVYGGFDVPREHAHVARGGGHRAAARRLDSRALRGVDLRPFQMRRRAALDHVLAMLQRAEEERALSFLRDNFTADDHRVDWLQMHVTGHTASSVYQCANIRELPPPCVDKT